MVVVLLYVFLFIVFQSTIPIGIKGCYFTTQAFADLPIGGVVDVPLAQTGEGIAECELLKWFVQEVSR